MAAIFGDEVVKGGWKPAQPGPSSAAVTLKNRRTRLLSLHLQLAAPVPLAVCCAEEGIATMEQVSSLMPVNLLVALPPDYPQRSMPAFNIDAPFLSVPMLVALAQALVDLFVVGEPVLYTWADFILGDAWDTVLAPMFEKTKEQVIENELAIEDDEEAIDYSAMNLDAVYFLDLDDTMYLSSVNPKLRRSIKRAERPFHDVVRVLLDHCDRVDFERMQRSYFLCPVCMEKKHGRDCLMLRQCRQVSCKECLSQFWTNRIDDGLVTKMHLVCMDPECRAPATPDEIARVVSLEKYERYEQLMLVGAIMESGDAVYCPRPFCQKPASKDYGEPTLGRCAYCAFVFCVDCGKSWHGKALCSIPEEEIPVEEEGCEEDDPVEVEDATTIGKRERKVRRISPLMQRLGIKPCPRCLTLVSKEGGCSHMKCRCGCDWCWICGAEMTPNEVFFRCVNGCPFSEEDEQQEQYTQLMDWLTDVAYG